MREHLKWITHSLKDRSADSPYECPSEHWELDEHGQPTQRINPTRRGAKFITPIPKPRKRKGKVQQEEILLNEDQQGLSTKEQQYAQTSIIEGVRKEIDLWRQLPHTKWRVTPETARLLQHWRHHRFSDIRPFFCQVEAAEVVIWLTEVAPLLGNTGRHYLEHLVKAKPQRQPRVDAPSPKAGNRGRQNHGHGDVNRLANHQRYPLPSEKALHAWILDRHPGAYHS